MWFRFILNALSVARVLRLPLVSDTLPDLEMA